MQGLVRDHVVGRKGRGGRGEGLLIQAGQLLRPLCAEGEKTLGYLRPTELYYMDVPGHSKHDLERTEHLTPVFPLHEQLAESMQTDVGTLTRLCEKNSVGRYAQVLHGTPHLSR